MDSVLFADLVYHAFAVLDDDVFEVELVGEWVVNDYGMATWGDEAGVDVDVVFGRVIWVELRHVDVLIVFNVV